MRPFAIIMAIMIFAIAERNTQADEQFDLRDRSIIHSALIKHGVLYKDRQTVHVSHPS